MAVSKPRSSTKKRNIDEVLSSQDEIHQRLQESIRDSAKRFKPNEPVEVKKRELPAFL
jgi:regulator of protease activity HflC (stomatin/prohibitin superfamily)